MSYKDTTLPVYVIYPILFCIMKQKYRTISFRLLYETSFEKKYNLQEILNCQVKAPQHGHLPVFLMNLNPEHMSLGI